MAQSHHFDQQKALHRRANDIEASAARMGAGLLLKRVTRLQWSRSVAAPQNNAWLATAANPTRSRIVHLRCTVGDGDEEPIHTKKGRLSGGNKRPKSREETPNEGQRQRVLRGQEVRYHMPISKTIAISGSIARR